MHNNRVISCSSFLMRSVLFDHGRLRTHAHADKREIERQ